MIPRSWGNHIPYRHDSLPRLTPGPDGQHSQVHYMFSTFLEVSFGKRFRSLTADNWKATLENKDVAQRVSREFAAWYERLFPAEAREIARTTGMTLQQWFVEQERILLQHPEYWHW